VSSYELLRTLDRGGMAEVFLARLVGIEGFEKRVVLKRVLPHLAKDERFIGRFFDEARTAAQLAHPNIVQIFELGEERGQYFIAMEFVEGKNLRDVCKALSARGERMPPEHALRITSLILDGLSHAHTRRDPDGRPLGIVHRDVSPSNILLSWDGGLKIIDFGIAKTLDAVERTRPGSIIGKMGYMSPEQCRGEPVDPRSDVFAAGVVLYRMLFDQLPFPGKTEAQVGESIVKGIIVDPELRDPDVPAPIAELLRTALEPDREARFASARKFQIAVDKCLASLGLFASSGTLAELLDELFAEDRAFSALPDRSADATQSRVVTLVGSLPTASDDEPQATMTGVAPEPATATDDGATVALAPEKTVTATVRMSADELAALAGAEPPEPAVKRPDLSGLSPPQGQRASTLPRLAVGVVAGLLLVGGASTLLLDRDETPPTDVDDSVDPAPSAAIGDERDDPSPADDASPQDDDPSGPIDTPAPWDTEPAEPPRTPPTQPPPGASAEPSPTRDASDDRSGRRRRRRNVARPKVATGTLEVVSLPWAQVYVDGKRKGITPIAKLTIAEGTHQIVLVNPEQKLKKKLTVKVSAGAHQRVAVRLAD
jgi:serine/threonine protein kinase